MAAVTGVAEVEGATWVVGAEVSMGAVEALVVDITGAPEVTVAGITEAAPMVEAAVIAAADTQDAVTAHLVPVAHLQLDLGRGKAIVPDAILLRDGMGLPEIAREAGLERRMPLVGQAVPNLADPPETSHLMQRPPMAIGTLLVVPEAQP